MKIGCCLNMVAKDAKGVGIDLIEQLADAGYDYVELPLAQIMSLDEDEFTVLVKRLQTAGINCEACNNFFPADIRLTGEDTSEQIITDYITNALNRVEILGAKTVVFGSAGAKNIPAGFSYETAWQQIVTLLQKVDTLIGQRDITIAIEPLNHLESNIVITTSEGLKLAKEVDRKHIRLLVDFYHYSVEGEDTSAIIDAAQYLQHMHIANPNGRIYPAPQDGVDYKKFTKALAAAGYNSRISVEAFTDSFEIAAQPALQTMRAACE